MFIQKGGGGGGTIKHGNWKVAFRYLSDRNSMYLK